jgi:hypothetical protein
MKQARFDAWYAIVTTPVEKPKSRNSHRGIIMAKRYWVGGTANWDATAGTKWVIMQEG